MTTQIKRRRGTTTQHASFTGAEGELTIDTTKDTVVVHDGSTAGGHPLAKASEAVAKSGDTMTGNLSFGDNDKAIFGAGSDLQIYHDSNNSYIKDAGTGNIVIGADAFTYIGNPSATTTAARFNATGAQVFNHNNSQKLATTSTGIDVTGEITADGLTVDGVGSLTSSSTELLDLTSTGGDSLIRFGSLNSNFDVRIGSPSNPSTANGSFVVRTAGDDRLLVANNGDISFYEDQGTTPKFHWSAADESLGIGTSSPTEKLEVIQGSGTTTRAVIGGGTQAVLVINGDRDNSGDGGEEDATILLATDGSYDSSVNSGLGSYGFRIGAINNGGSTGLKFTEAQNGSDLERMRITSSGSVGIGTSSPSALLHVAGDARIGAGTGDASLMGMVASGDNFKITTSSSVGTVSFDRNVGIGVVPSSWGDSTRRALQVNSGSIDSVSTSQILIRSNNYYDGSDSRYVNTAAAAAYQQLSGVHTWFTAASGTADDIISFSEAMRISSSGLVGIGTTSPSQKLDISAGYLNFSNGYGIRWGGNTTEAIYGNNTGNLIGFQTNGSEAMRISSGSLLVGQTVGNVYNQSSVTGLKLDGANGNIQTARANNASLLLNRYGTDGDIASFKKDGSTVGSIGTYADKVYIGNGDTGLRFVNTSNQIRPFNTSTLADRDAGFSLGSSGARFTDLYLSGGVVFGATSGSVTSKTLDDYEEGTWTPTYTSSSTDPTFSPNLQNGVYTKIGRMVYASFRLRGAISGTKTGNLRLSGLPFTANSSPANGSGSIGLTEVFGADNYPTNLRVNQSATYINLMVYDNADSRDGLFTNVTVTSTSGASDGNYIIGHVVYQTD